VVNIILEDLVDRMCLLLRDCLDDELLIMGAEEELASPSTIEEARLPYLVIIILQIEGLHYVKATPKVLLGCIKQQSEGTWSHTGALHIVLIHHSACDLIEVHLVSLLDILSCVVITHELEDPIEVLVLGLLVDILQTISLGYPIPKEAQHDT
jgi:hypothetical protein